MTFIIESIIICLLFQLLVFWMVAKDPMGNIEDFPPAVVQWAQEQNLISKSVAAKSKRFYISKSIKLLVTSIILSIIVTFINKAETFWQGFGISYSLWLIVDWYDAFIMDLGFCTHCKFLRIPGSEDMDSLYRDNWFHIKMSIIGMVLGIPACILAGLFTIALNLL